MNVSKLLLLFLSLSAATAASAVSCGKVIRHTDFGSAYIGSRHIDVWLPPDYDSTCAHQVLYMQDGQNLFEASTSAIGQEWRMDEVLCQLIQSKTIDPVIVVGIWNTPQRRQEYFPSTMFNSFPVSLQDSLMNGGGVPYPMGDEYLTFLVEELMPFIRNRYPVSVQREDTFIGGSSMGGLISIYALCEYPDVFGGAMCISTHWIGNFRKTYDKRVVKEIANYLLNKLPVPADHRIYFDHGNKTLDALYPEAQRIIDSVMVQRGYESSLWTTRFYDGEEHSERSWSKRVHIPLEWLLN